MPNICYVPKRFNKASRVLIDQANEIITDYQRQGYSLTLRQLYYQFVSKDWLANTLRNYKRLGSVVNDARLAGEMDWNAIEDRTRNLTGVATWDSPEDIVRACAKQFTVDRWETQPYHVEVWCEKEALAGVFSRVCNDNYVDYFSCRGYVSQSEMWRAARRLARFERDDKTTLILHFGDHDPSGLDMTRDIQSRLQLFGADTEVRRIALNMDQVEEYGPPPNPAKLTDARAEAYVDMYGDESWELDALEPRVLAALVQAQVDDLICADAWDEKDNEETRGRAQLKHVADTWSDIVEEL